MLPNRTFYIMGASFVFVAAFVLYYSFQGLTGYAVSEQTGLNVSYYLALWFFIAGILILSFPKISEKKK